MAHSALSSIKCKIHHFVYEFYPAVNCVLVWDVMYISFHPLSSIYLRGNSHHCCGCDCRQLHCHHHHTCSSIMLLHVVSFAQFN